MRVTSSALSSSAGDCDPNSGQCHCLPNVSGLRCDACIENYWKIASGEGCEPCACDLTGSISPQCNEFDGQCQCKSSFGGRQCNDCMPGFYGDPKVNCLKCECDHQGARTEQCNMQTGACVCLPGVGGYKCDRCDRGYIGNVPDCIPYTTLEIVDRASEIKKGGATEACTKEFEDIQIQLEEINNC
ncbi:hypothetical protein NQ318_002476 [Aromia moschata]|uniref:Laminin EGF-like domain-containing protein n=1 Tax=Aromia moschata TaxID=1265417 RepID=A0AAV8Y808_9CUCU|nr:hypothetical protein NQ318_002476 [Aromia moschata]